MHMVTVLVDFFFFDTLSTKSVLANNFYNLLPRVFTKPSFPYLYGFFIHLVYFAVFLHLLILVNNR